MTKPKPNYWKSDQLSPSELKEIMYDCFKNVVKDVVLNGTAISYDSTNKEILLHFSKEEFDFSIPDDKVQEIVNGEEQVSEPRPYSYHSATIPFSGSWDECEGPIDTTSWGNERDALTNNFIYDRLLKSIKEKNDIKILRYCDNTTRNILWRIFSYLGVSNEVRYGSLVDDEIWEIVHNE